MKYVITIDLDKVPTEFGGVGEEIALALTDLAGLVRVFVSRPPFTLAVCDSTGGEIGIAEVKE